MFPAKRIEQNVHISRFPEFVSLKYELFMINSPQILATSKSPTGAEDMFVVLSVSHNGSLVRPATSSFSSSVSVLNKK
jgi:hypothetical protein